MHNLTKIHTHATIFTEKPVMGQIYRITRLVGESVEPIEARFLGSEWGKLPSEIVKYGTSHDIGGQRILWGYFERADGGKFKRQISIPDSTIPIRKQQKLDGGSANEKAQCTS